VNGWERWNEDQERFTTLTEVRAWLATEYGNCKREPMYIDTDTGPRKIGVIYCYNTPKCSYDDTAKHNRDWVEVLSVTATPVLVTRQAP
jgi:hypothetical protein